MYKLNLSAYGFVSHYLLNISIAKKKYLKASILINTIKFKIGLFNTSIVSAILIIIILVWFHFLLSVVYTQYLFSVLYDPKIIIIYDQIGSRS